MPNRSSKAGHIPERTCVICKEKKEQKYLVRFVILNNEIVYDLSRNIAARGYYVCDVNLCLEKIEKWFSKKKKKQVKNG